MQSIITFLETRQGMGVVGLVLIGLYILYSNWNKIKPSLPTWAGGGDAVISRRQVWDNLEANYDYFESVGCPEGMQLMKDATQHVFHDEAPTDPLTDGPQTPSATDQLVNRITEALKRTNHPSVSPPPVTGG